ncbi:MAG: hypothetical protein JRN06_03195 [Nitrososphaerota archaeon]|nr:hypothetical protein [Nitrososphaerota archaeon]MDG7023136.1 hypothetical protein [Nitrososphaerota archaeon]
MSHRASVAKRIPLYAVVVVFTVIMYLLFANDGIQFAILSVAEGAFFGFVMYHFDSQYQKWRKESALS